MISILADSYKLINLMNALNVPAGRSPISSITGALQEASRPEDSDSAIDLALSYHAHNSN